MSCLSFLRCHPPPGQAALTFLPFHALHSFPTPWEINMSFTTPGSLTLNFTLWETSQGKASAGTDSSLARHKHLIQGNRSPPLSDPGSLFYSCCSAVRNALSTCSGCTDLALQVPLLQGALAAPALGSRLPKHRESTAPPSSTCHHLLIACWYLISPPWQYMAWGQRPVSTWNLLNYHLAWKWGSFTEDKNPQIWLEAEPPASVTGSRIILHWGWSPSWTRSWDPKCLWAGSWACASLCVHVLALAAVFLSFSPLSPSLPLSPSISSEFSFIVLLYK